MIAFLGTGLIGSGFVRGLLARGEQVHAWNRNAGKARATGAQVFEDPAEAVRGASRVHLSLSDDAAVDAVLERAAPGFAADVIICDHTTTSPSGTAARIAAWDARGIPFVHAPVFMGPQNAREATGVMVSCGDRARFDRIAPELAKMTGKLLYVGAANDRAAAMKLFGNMFLMFLTSGLADMFAFAKCLGIAPTEAATLFEAFNPGATIGARAKRMLAVDQPASWELAMARKDARLMLEEAARHDVTLAVLPTIAALMDRYIAAGHGADDWTVIGKDSI